MADYTDLSEANGWIPEPSANDVLTRVTETSAVEQAARKVTMTSRTVSVPRFEADGVDVVPEHDVIPFFDADLDEVVLTAIKFANRFAVSIEDQEDAVVDALAAAKAAWLSNYAVKLDNAVLGTVGAANGTTRPFTSVYQAVGAPNRTATAGALSYEQLEDAMGSLDEGLYGGNAVVIAHPAFKGSLRNLKDSDGNRVSDGLLDAGTPTLFGNNVIFTRGAVASTTASDRPTGNPIMVVANKQHLILGVRSGPESAVSDAPQWDTDHVELKMRARRAFALATPDAARVIELTASA